MEELKKEIALYKEFCKRNGLAVNNANNLKSYFENKEK